jgi:hypothetical protein
MASMIRSITNSMIAKHMPSTPVEAGVQSLLSLGTGLAIGFAASKHKGGLDAGKIPLDGVVGLGLSLTSVYTHGATSAITHRIGHDLLVVSGFRHGEILGHGGKAGKAKAALMQAAASGTPVPASTAAAATATGVNQAAATGTPITVSASGEIEQGIDEAIEEGGLHAGDAIVQAARHL